MIKLQIYNHNSNGDTLIYDCLKLYFQGFFYGQKRDETNLLIIRMLAEGNILLKHPTDFDILKDYFFSKQDAFIYIESVLYLCQVNFIKPNYLTKEVLLNLTFIDDYSEMFEGSQLFGWSISQIPRIQKKFKISDFDVSIDSVFVDGSQYMYDVQAPGSELWGTESIIVDKDKDVKALDILKWNKGDDDLEIGELIVGEQYLNADYKPYFIKYTDWSVTKFRHVHCEYRREFRYFEETEDIPGGWNEAPGIRTLNGFTYNKYVRPLFGDQTYFSREDIYFIRDEATSNDYIAVTFAGINTELQKSKYFYNLNQLLEQLTIRMGVYFTSFNSVISSDYFTASLKTYNCNCRITDKFSFDYFIDFLRNKFEIYFEFKNNEASFKSLSFTEKLFDLDNYKNYNFILNKEVILNNVPNLFKFQSASKSLDFRNQDVSFYGYNPEQKSISEGVITDIENTEKDENAFMLIKTKEEYHDQIYEQFVYDGFQNGTEAIFRSLNGKYVSWEDSYLDQSTYIDIKLYSNAIYLDIDNDIQLSYGVIIYEGSVTISIGSYSATHSSSTSVNTFITGSTAPDGDHLVIRVSNKDGGDAGGFVYGIKVKVRTNIPKAATGVISGISKKNGNLSLANTIKAFKPLMSYPDGFLEDHGVLVCNTLYSKEINVKVPLNEAMFDLDLNKYVSVGSEEYIIFERKRQILTETEISKTDILRLKSKEIY